MFAEVIPFRPSGFANILTYKIEEISKNAEVGDIAEIAMGTSREKCVIIKLLETEPDFKTKSLGRIIAKNIFSASEIKNICDIAGHFFTSPSHILKKAIPANIRNTNFINSTEFVNIAKNTVEKKENNSIEKNINIKISLGSVYSKRSIDEVNFIKKNTENNNQQVVVIFPDIISLEQAFSQYENIFSDICVFHSQVSKKKQIEAFWKIKTGNTQIIFGTQYSLCIPFFNLSGIIVYEFAHGSHYTKFSPFTQTMRSAEIVAKNMNIPLLYTSCAGDIATLTQNKNSEIVKHQKMYASQKQIHIVDMQLEHQNKNFSPLSALALQKIKENLQNNKKTILYINRKGLHHYIKCPNCGDSPVSQYTGSKMNVFKNEKNQIVLRCNTMGYAQKIETSEMCENCKVPMQKIGAGTQAIEEILENLDAKILRIDGDSFQTKSSQKRMREEIKTADIIIGTQMMLSLGSIAECSLIIDILFENNLQFFSFTTEEIAWIQTHLLEEMFEKPQENMQLEYIIQTFQPNLQIIQNHDNFENFYASEILSRKILKYPPFTEGLEIEIRAKVREKCESDIQKVIQILQEDRTVFFPPEIKSVPHTQSFLVSVMCFMDPEKKELFLGKLGELKVKYFLRVV
ncbi:TPA: hypothetical protein EYP45_03925 [Candidatus Peregrinibacteria bacterium]|nr:hypothetical protein [Candidatus Peregrinibacteria bacterium]HIQ57503.1 hypothetical protein [Candidatus Gracilibacteria bacterium]